MSWGCPGMVPMERNMPTNREREIAHLKREVLEAAYKWAMADIASQYVDDAGRISSFGRDPGFVESQATTLRHNSRLLYRVISTPPDPDLSPPDDESGQ